jgi:hypothetical protein
VSRLALLLLVCVSVLSCAPSAYASERRVALVQGDPELQRALTLALAAWDVETVFSDAELPQSAQPQAVLQAAALARKLRVDGVVWISQSVEGSVLWIFDARTGEATTRVLTESPPFESAGAAGVALSVKTALRTSVEPGQSRPSTRPIIDAPPLGDAPVPVPEPPRERERVTLKVGGEAHFIANHSTQARLTLSSVVWLTESPRLGVGLALAGGEGVKVSTPSFVGRYRDLAFGPALHLRLLSRSVTAASVFVGGAVHAALLDGTVVPDATEAVVKRYNVSVDAGGQLDFRLGGGIYLGVAAQAAFLPAYQRYLVDTAPVFSPWRLSASAGGHCGVELF